MYRGRSRSWFIPFQKETWPVAIKTSREDSQCPNVRLVYSGEHFIILALELFELVKACR